jgi:hypothetical protein
MLILIEVNECWLSVSLILYLEATLTKRHRWSRGSVLVFRTQLRGFRPDRIRRIFQGEKKILQHAFLRKGSKVVGPIS